jgi:hypothetical protein
MRPAARRQLVPEFACIAAIVLVACGSVSIDAGPAPVAAQTGSIWTHAGAMLPAGHRAAVADGSGWVLTQPFIDDTLELAKLSLADGSLVNSVAIDTSVHGYSGASLTADGAGHLWITYGQRLVRFDEVTGTTTTWSLPAVLPRLPTENPLAGSALANAWDSSTKKLLFVRNDDQRLYSFDPSTSAFAVASELPITTSSITGIAVGPVGEVAVTGSVAGVADFMPAAVRLASLTARPEMFSDVEAVCARSSGLTYLRSSGAVSLDGNIALATILTPLTTQVPFACDSGNNVFEATVGGGKVTIVRVSQSGGIAAVSDALIPVVVHGLTGPVSSFANPRVVAVMPDLQGGAWVVCEAGTNSSTNAGSAYPSLAHVRFTT